MIEALIALRVLAHLVTFGALAFWYKDPDAKFRPGVSFTATIVAGSSFASAFLLMTAPPRTITATFIFETLLIASFAGLVVMARGNMARLFPRQIWTHR